MWKAWVPLRWNNADEKEGCCGVFWFQAGPHDGMDEVRSVGCHQETFLHRSRASDLHLSKTQVPQDRPNTTGRKELKDWNSSPRETRGFRRGYKMS